MNLCMYVCRLLRTPGYLLSTSSVHLRCCIYLYSNPSAAIASQISWYQIRQTLIRICNDILDTNNNIKLTGKHNDNKYLIYLHTCDNSQGHIQGLDL
jgi:hypothetical protein